MVVALLGARERGRVSVKWVTFRWLGCCGLEVENESVGISVTLATIQSLYSCGLVGGRIERRGVSVLLFTSRWQGECRRTWGRGLRGEHPVSDGAGLGAFAWLRQCEDYVSGCIRCHDIYLLLIVVEKYNTKLRTAPQ